MDKRKKAIFFAVLFMAVAAMIAFAYASAPPKVTGDDCGEDHSEQSVSVLEGEITPVNPASAKYLTIQLNQLDGEAGANNIANALAALGSIGKIKCDMTTKQFNVQYDAKTMDKEKILQTFEKAGYPGTVIQGS
ncbi:MAG: hypothetical protein QME41_01640 [Actinomycetota bacterium]|nr:hypothetical protein [Actinomycetota bacterium]